MPNLARSAGGGVGKRWGEKRRALWGWTLEGSSGECGSFGWMVCL
jgi:hypothetical protein